MRMNWRNRIEELRTGWHGHLLGAATATRHNAATSRFTAPRRPGTTLVLFALLLTLLIGFMGLVIDLGLMMSSFRQAQNAADAAAMAGAYEMMLGRPADVAEASAATFVQSLNGLTTAEGPFLRIPPTQGAYAGSSNAVEAVVTVPHGTMFIHVLGTSRTQTVTARAVANYENVASGEGAAVLDPTAIPGISLDGNGKLFVNGDVTVNSIGGGVDENGNPVNNGSNGYAADAGNKFGIHANHISVVGGVNDPDMFQNFDALNTASPLKTRQLPEPDPLALLPTPSVANGVIATNFGSVSVGSGNATLNPGVYTQIRITGGNVTFNPGIYVIAAENSAALTLSGNGTIVGRGVMFYNTGSNYDVATGAPDNTDPADALGSSPPGTLPGVTLGDVSITTSVTLSPIDTTDTTINYTGEQRTALTPFNGMLFYQRRYNNNRMTISGDSSEGALTGTVYGKWMPLTISGSGTYSAQFIVGSIKLSGNGTVTLVFTGKNIGKAPAVFLVN